MIVESELREQMAHAVAGQSSLHELYHWLMSRSWNMHRDSNSSAVQLAAEVEMLFFDKSDGLISDEEIIEGLRQRLNTIPASSPSGE